MKNKWTPWLVAFVVTVMCMTPFFFGVDMVNAGNTAEGGSVTLPNPLKNDTNDLFSFLELIFDTVIIPIGALICALAIMYAGFLFVTAQGDAKQLEIAKKALLYAVIGTAVLLGAWALASGIDCTIKRVRGLTC